MSLRFIMRDGKKILQQSGKITVMPGIMSVAEIEHHLDQWTDVPLVEEPKKPREWWMLIRDNSDAKADLMPSYIAPFGSIKPMGDSWIKVREILE